MQKNTHKIIVCKMSACSINDWFDVKHNHHTMQKKFSEVQPQSPNVNQSNANGMIDCHIYLGMSKQYSNRYHIN